MGARELGEQRLVIEESPEGLAIAFDAPGFGGALVFRLLTSFSFAVMPILLWHGSTRWHTAVWLLAWSAACTVAFARMLLLARTRSVLLISLQGVSLEEHSPVTRVVHRSALEDFIVLALDREDSDGSTFDWLPLRGLSFRFAGHRRRAFIGHAHALLSEAERRIVDWLERHPGAGPELY